MGGDGVLDTIERLRKLVEMRGECAVFCLVKSETGLEIVSNVEDYVLQRGMIKVGEEMCLDHHYQIQALLDRETQRAMAEGSAAMGGFRMPVKREVN